MRSGKIFSYSSLKQQQGRLVAGLEKQHKGFHPWSVINVSTQNLLFIHFREHITDGVMT